MMNVKDPHAGHVSHDSQPADCICVCKRKVEEGVLYTLSRHLPCGFHTNFALDPCNKWRLEHGRVHPG
jgi:hypothetical protein